MKKLSSTEQTIYELVKMKDSIEGLNNSHRFGQPTSSQNKEDVPQVEVTEISSGRILLPTSSSSENANNRSGGFHDNKFLFGRKEYFEGTNCSPFICDKGD